MNPITEQKYINKIRELEKRIEKLENKHTNCPYADECTSGWRTSYDYMKAVRKDCGLYE